MASVLKSPDFTVNKMLLFNVPKKYKELYFHFSLPSLSHDLNRQQAYCFQKRLDMT